MLNFIDPTSRVLVYEGSSKKIYLGPDPGTLIVSLKSEDNNSWKIKISESLWSYFAKLGVQTHFIKIFNVKEYLIKSLDISHVFIKIYNISDQSLHNRLGIEQGTEFLNPFFEWHLNSSALNNPPLCREHIDFFKWVDRENLEKMKSLAFKVNDLLKALFLVKLKQVRFGAVKLHFGLDKQEDSNGELFLAGDMSSENIDLWDSEGLVSKSKKYDLMRNMWVEWM